MMELVAEHGMKSWSFIAKQLQGRLGKQCRERSATIIEIYCFVLYFQWYIFSFSDGIIILIRKY